MIGTWKSLLEFNVETWFWHLFTIPLGLLVANCTEWIVHKYVLHGLGKNKKSFWSFHWNEHHKASRKNDFFDPDYKRSVLTWNAQSKEILGLVFGGLIYLPLLVYAPFFYLTLVYCGFRYHYVHRRSHLDPNWARKNLPWHFDHHMGSNQDANWCVTKPWFDWIMRTRIKSVVESATTGPAEN